MKSLKSKILFLLGTNIILLFQLKNMVGQFKKAYLHRPIKILFFLTTARIQKCLRILTGKKDCQIKLHQLQIALIWAFGSSVHQVNSS